MKEVNANLPRFYKILEFLNDIKSEVFEEDSIDTINKYNMLYDLVLDNIAKCIINKEPPVIDVLVKTNINNIPKNLFIHVYESSEYADHACIQLLCHSNYINDIMSIIEFLRNKEIQI